MQTDVQLPTAFSVQNEDEFYPIQHLLARMNPRLMVEQVATGMHRNGCHTVLSVSYTHLTLPTTPYV